MGRLSPIQTNFTAGELSPRVNSRIDIAKYNNGLKRGENLQFLVQGGARRREGSRFVAEVKDSSRYTRLIEFIFNREQAYMLEFGHQYMRVFKDGAPVLVLGVPYEIATPYTETQLDDISYVQGADTMFLAHVDVPTQRLQRFGDASWRLLQTPFTVQPFDELGHSPAVTLSLSGASVGAGRNFSATGAFLQADVGRDIVSGSGLATITGYVDANNATVEVKSAFAATSIPSGAWTIDGSPQAACTVSAATPVGAAVTLTLGTNGWRAADVGKYVKVNDGLVLLTGYSTATVFNGVIRQALSTATAAIANSWTLNASVWNALSKYPRAVTLHEQRLQLAGSPGYPQTLWGSRIGDVLNFEIGSKDADAFAYELTTSQIAPIQHLAQTKRLMVFTNFNEMSVRGGVEKPILPTSIQKSDESTAGANNVRPVKVGNEILFVQRAGRKVRACGYRYDIDGFDSPDRTVFSEHITESGVVDMAFQQEPDAQLYCVRGDGQIANCTYNTEQEVIAWGRWLTQGYFECVATIPTPDSEQTWFIAQRTIDGVEKRYIEYFDPSLKTDSGRTTTGSNLSTWSGFGHLEGKTVKVLADGVYQGEQQVIGGQITTPRPANAVEVGLGYTPLMTLLNPEVGSQAGTSQGAAISVNGVKIRVLNTVGILINGKMTKDFRRLGARLLDRAPAPGTGDLREVTLSSELYSNELTISQPDPVDFHVLGVIRQMGVND